MWAEAKNRFRMASDRVSEQGRANRRTRPLPFVNGVGLTRWAMRSRTPIREQIGYEETNPHATPGGSTCPGLARDAMSWHLKQIDQTLHLSRQAHLVRLGLSIAELG